MTTKYLSTGSVINHVAAADISSNDVVPLQHCIGIALADIQSGETGAVAIEGEFEVPKVSAAVFAIGEKLLFDSSAGSFDDSSATPAAGDLMGAVVATKPGLNGETTCWVKLTPGNVART